ncbi:MAG TPA: T9SS type A sorting domain-containing protein, partial [candidate division WOR-3 bacterium]|nr:T9SS type A sorting domain-containing protein [candidate division WOR-3 bacterium]
NGYGIFCNVSIDGGLSFLDTPIAVTDTLNNDARYAFVAIGADEKIYVVWQDSRLGNSDIYFSKGEIITGIEENNSYSSPISFELMESYPNPFNASTSIKYTLPTRAHIELNIYNIQGQLVRTLLSGEKSPGTHKVNWDGRNERGRNVSSGIYFYQLKMAGGIQKTRKMILLK